MKTLFVTHLFPYPQDVGSKIRAFNLLKIYSSVSKVTLVCFIKGENELKGMQELNQYCEHIYTVPNKTCLFNRVKNTFFLRYLEKFFSITPLSIKRFRSKEMSKIIEKIKTEEFELVHVGRVHIFSNILRLFRKQRILQKFIIDFDDYESKKLLREFYIEKKLKGKFLLFLEFLRMLNWENVNLRRFDACLVCSTKDKITLEKLKITNRVVVVPNGANILQNQKINSGSGNSSMLYLGAMDYEPNSDAALYFAKEILPLIKKEVPSVKFVIAGRNPFPEVQALHDGENVFVTGYFTDARKIFSENTIFVVPLRSGGGTRIKILEAMAMGKAVVSTDIGCEGIEATNGENIIIADKPEDFAYQCIELLRNSERRKQIGDCAQRFIAEHYEWNKIGEKYSSYLKTELMSFSN